MRPTFTKAYHGPGYPEDLSRVEQVFNYQVPPPSEAQILALESVKLGLHPKLHVWQRAFFEQIDQNLETGRVRLVLISPPLRGRRPDGMVSYPSRRQSIVGFKEECGKAERNRDWSEFKSAEEIWASYDRIKATGDR